VSAENLTGSKVEDYDVLSRLGGGGMGVVYEGRAADGRRVAIKTLKPVFTDDGEIVGRFLAEARALKAISHKALVEIFSIGQLNDGTHYFVMEFLEGRTFEDVIKHGAPLEPREVLPWLVEILDALDAVHAHGIIHRDLKPSNLFLARTGVGPQVKLIDFGVAKHTGKSTPNRHHTAVSAIVGTPDYMSPEQVSGDPVTGASDLYALGCVMFEMLTGELPFSDDSEVKKMMMHMERPAPLPSSKVRVPREVDEVVEWMLQKDPSKRPPSAIALKRRLETMMIELGAHGPPVTTQVPIVRASPPKVTDPAVAAVKPADWPKNDFAGLDPTRATPGRKRRTGPVAAGRKGVHPVVWLVIAGTALLGTGLIIARWTRPRPVMAPEMEAPSPAPEEAEKPSQSTPAEEPATTDVQQPESAAPPPPPPPPPIRHKRPPVPPPKHKPPTAAAKDKRHGR
jgi:serine/threonine protein kinase